MIISYKQSVLADAKTLIIATYTIHNGAQTYSSPHLRCYKVTCALTQQMHHILNGPASHAVPFLMYVNQEEKKKSQYTVHVCGADRFVMRRYCVHARARALAHL